MTLMRFPHLISLAVAARVEGDGLGASRALERIKEIDPMSHIPFAERWLAEDGE